MKPANKWMLATAAVAGVGVAVLVSKLSACEGRESSPSYSPDGKYYYQMQFTLCKDHKKSHSQLILGQVATKASVVLLDLSPLIGTLDLRWSGEELHVAVPEAAIVKRYGPYEEFPTVVVTDP